MTNYQYRVGGSIPADDPTYVERQADRDLYEGLKNNGLCYVLNSRQMGKSSLRVRTMRRLQAEGYVCAAIDLTSISTSDITADQWYAGVIDSIVNSLNLYNTFNLMEWWTQHSQFDHVTRFSKFIQEVLLKQITEKIVIFIDEIDSVRRLKFQINSFFAVIRECYDKRASEPEYRRLRFVLLGVATPTELIREENRTPFGVGQAIELTGFTLKEARPLAAGLATKANNPEAVLKAVLYWTGGQPFLSQKVCKLIKDASEAVPDGREAKWVENLVRTKVIQNWESQDEPEHLRTIRDRLLKNSQTPERLLELYQQILQRGKIAADSSPEEAELRVSGLVVKEKSTLRVYNPIYKEVFNRRWVKAELGETPNFIDLILEKLWEWRSPLAGAAIVLCVALVGGIIYKLIVPPPNTSTSTSTQVKVDDPDEPLPKFNENQALSKKLSGAVKSIAISWEEKKIVVGGREGQKSLITVWDMETMDLLQTIPVSGSVNAIAISPDGSKIVSGSSDGNIGVWDIDTGAKLDKNLMAHTIDVLSVAISPDGSTIVSGDREGTIKVWDINTQREKDLENRPQQINSWVNAVAISPDGEKIVSGGTDKTIRVWDLNTGKKLIKPIRDHNESILSVVISPDGRIVSGHEQGTIKVWDLSTGNYIKTVKEHGDKVNSLAISDDGKILVSGSKDEKIIVWDLNKMQIFQILTGHTVEVTSVAISPDGKTIVSGSATGKIKVWQATD